MGMALIDESRRVQARAIIDALPDAVVVIDSAGNVRDANQAAERVMGAPLETWIDVSGLDLIHPDDVHLAALSLVSVQDKSVGSPVELRLRTDRGWRLMEVVGAPMGDGLIVLSMRDLTQRRRWEIAGDDVASFRSLVQNAASLTMLLDRTGIVRSTSSAITRMLGHDPEAVCDAALLAIVHDDDRAAVEVALARATVTPSGAPPVTVETRLTQFGGLSVPFELTIVSLLDDPTVRGLVVSGHDITRLRQAREALDQLAHFDGLTGLPNRRTFDTALEQEWNGSHDGGDDSCLVVVDLDGFKALNDRFGHAAGDEALRQFAAALRLSVRQSDVVARLGGDEFAVILVGAGDTATVQFEETLRQRLVERFDSLAAPIGFTAGHACLASAISPERALHQADMAMLDRKLTR